VEQEVQLKTSVEVARVRRSCRIAELTLRHLAQLVKPGVTSVSLERAAVEFIERGGGMAALKGYRGFPASICASPNNVTAHGVPDENPLQEGDVLTLDVTVEVEGWYGDAAWTYAVGDVGDDRMALIRAAWRACIAGLVSARAGGYIGDVGHAVSAIAARHGFSVVTEYVGHGIGQAMHEEPRIPHVGVKGAGPRIVAGMTFTVEPVITAGSPDVVVMDDGWTVATADGSLSAQFEHTVAVYRDGLEILTLSEMPLRDCLDEPPYF
jgi:methionyl aminopeptidase